MNLDFYKYQGTGNDFLLIDNRAKIFPKEDTTKIARLCDRHFGVGADGLILLENDVKTDFRMIYYNADGSQGTMCGNGGRCIVAFAKELKIIKDETTFMAIDGLHYAKIKESIVSLQMIDVNKVEVYENHIFTNTGSPHHVELVNGIDDYQVVNAGRKLRNSYGKRGSNINFVEQITDTCFKVRTYERGVEGETLACGTGVTATAIAMHKIKKTTQNKIHLQVLGGNLEVSFDEKNGNYTKVFLKGTATFVFSGRIELNIYS